MQVNDAKGEPLTKILTGETAARAKKRISSEGILENSDGLALADDDLISPEGAPYVFKKLLEDHHQSAQMEKMMTALPDLLREVGISRKSRLNCWERESMRTSGSKRSKRFRRKVIEYYKRASNSGKKVKCQILDEYIFNNEAEDEATGIIAAHIWKASTRGHGLEEFGLRPEEVNSPRNGLFLTKGLEDALDHQQICFLYNLLENKIVLWVADTLLMNKTIAGSGKTTTDGSDMTFSDVHQKPLLCPPNCLPFRRLLSWHARLTLEWRPQTVDARRFTSAYDSPPGRENAVIDPITRAINEIVEPGDDAST